MREESGFSLIEVLVTLLLTTIGILGMVAMQSQGIQYTQDSVQRNAAVMFSNELIEIMRSNPQEIFEKPAASGPVYGKFKDISLFMKPAGSDFAVAPLACTAPSAAKTAQEQRDCWVSKVKAGLPEAATLFNNAFYICRSSVPGNCNGKGSMVEVQLAWSVKEGSCPDAGAPNTTTCIFRTRVEL